MNPTSFASASLYVGDLHPDVTETQLFEIFKQVGPVASIRVCRDAVTRRSLGYAYVNYHTAGDAERALDLLNYREIKGKPCRIMWSQRDPSVRRHGTGNIFIKNLDKTIDNKALYDTFATFGNILSCKVALDEHGLSRGFGFVHYDSQEAAEIAITKVNGMLLNGKMAYVGFFVPKKDRDQGSESEPKWTNIYIKNLNKSISEEKFNELFGQFGKVTSSVLAKDEEGNSKGFGFINYDSHEQAQAAIDTLNQKEIEGQELYVGKAQKKADREKELKNMFEKLKRERMSKYQGVNLYVKNLDPTIDDEKLRQEFAHCGTITSAKVMRDEKNASKGFGFVCFATPDEATKAVTDMNQKMILNKPIFVALAQRKEQRRAQLEAQHAQRVSGMRIPQPNIPNPMGYPGAAPVFYPPGAARSFMYPAPMNIRRFAGPQGAPRAYPAGPIPNQFVVGPVQARPPRQNMRPGPGGPKGQPGRPYDAMVSNFPQGPHVQLNPRTVNARNLQPSIQVEAEVDQKEMIGENLYKQIQILLKERDNDILSGKITGMLLDASEQSELLEMLENAELLQSKVQDAKGVLEAHNKTETAVGENA